MSAGTRRVGWIRNALQKREHVMNWLALLMLLSLGFLWHADPLDLPAAQNTRAADAADAADAATRAYASVTLPAESRAR
jgi:hypothetical protein